MSHSSRLQVARFLAAVGLALAVLAPSAAWPQSGGNYASRDDVRQFVDEMVDKPPFRAADPVLR